MNSKKTNIEVANIWIGYIFAKLYECFPVQYDFKLTELIEATNERPAIGNPSDFGLQLLNWLRDEGYIRGQNGPMGEEDLMDWVVLTERGLHVLNGIPDHLQQKKKIGERLVEASKELGKESVKTGVGELIGQVIGGIVKASVS